MGGESFPRAAPVLALVKTRPSSEEILRGLRRSDPDAARALYDEFGELVNTLVWRLLGADPEHDDVVHQAFVNILSSVRTVRNPAALGAWIKCVTVHTVRRELRSRRYRRMFRLAGDEEYAAAGGGRLARGCYAILDRIGTEERLAFLLHCVEGLGLAEVAELLGCSLATVKRRIARARDKLLAETAKDEYLAAVVEELRHED